MKTQLQNVNEINIPSFLSMINRKNKHSCAKISQVLGHELKYQRDLGDIPLHTSLRVFLYREAHSLKGLQAPTLVLLAQNSSLLHVS